MKKRVQKIRGYCSHWSNEEHCWVTDVPVDYLTALGYNREDRVVAKEIHKFLVENYLISGSNKAEFELWLKRKYEVEI